MHFIEYCAELLPQITLIGKDETVAPHKNINRVSEDYIFYFVTDGELFFCENGKEYHLQRGDCFLFEPGMHHFGTVNSSYHLIYIHFRHKSIRCVERSQAEWLLEAKERNKRWLTNPVISQAPDDTLILPKQVSLREPVSISALSELAEKAIDQSKNRLENYNTLCAGTVNELFIKLYREFLSSYFEKYNVGSKGIFLINRVIHYLNTDYPQRIDSRTIEAHLSYSFDYLNQLFKKNLGTTIFRVLESIRVENAKKLIKTTSLTLEQISVSVGYNDASYFSKIFKKRTGVPPSQYRSRD